MKIKTLAIALLSTTLFSTSIFAHIDGHDDVSSMKKMDKASPTNSAIQTSVDVAKTKSKNPGHIVSATEAVNPLYEGADGLSSETEVVESKAADGFLKIGDIQGESTRAADTIVPDRIEFKSAIAAPDSGDSDSDSDGDKDDSNNATDYNSSRSNKADSIAAPNPDNDDGDNDDGTNSKATDYNSSRSNKNTSGEIILDNDDSDDEDSECQSDNGKKEVCAEGHVTVLK